MHVASEDAQARRCQLGLAAEQGGAIAQSQCVLGHMHHGGQGGPKDLAEARRLLGLAAAQGHADAQLMLGKMKEQADADAMMAQLLAEDSEQKRATKARQRARRVPKGRNVLSRGALHRSC